MKFLHFKILLTSFSLLVLTINTKAQIEKDYINCNQNMGTQFISDGQQYQVFLDNTESAEFNVLFYENIHYRVSVCSKIGKKVLIFNIYDKENNLLFTNADFENRNFWDFQFKSTMNCTVEIKMNSKTNSSAHVFMAIGFLL